jgi:hypothetical protein
MSFHIRNEAFIFIPVRIRWIGDFADYFCSSYDIIADLNQSFDSVIATAFSLFELNIKRHLQKNLKFISFPSQAGFPLWITDIGV